jgi:hypothetical protein
MSDQSAAFRLHSQPNPDYNRTANVEGDQSPLMKMRMKKRLSGATEITNVNASTKVGDFDDTQKNSIQNTQSINPHEITI